MSNLGNESFFIGWMKIPPKALWSFLIFTSAVFLGALGGLAFSLSVSVDDPGDGRFAGRQQVVGILEAKPYPTLRLPPDGKGRKPQTILLSGVGKRGVVNLVESKIGDLVELSGTLIKRGNIDMLQINRRGINDPKDDLDERITSYNPTDGENLGRWRIVGEICDGKCYQGAMRPGRGLAHKACANLCLIGGIPPVFVSNLPVNGTNFFLLADQDGNPLTDEYLDLTAILIEMEGLIEKRDNLHIFKVDIGKARVI